MQDYVVGEIPGQIAVVLLSQGRGAALEGIAGVSACGCPAPLTVSEILP
jgi:hypothetical protein